jgi:hypothetical protein
MRVPCPSQWMHPVLRRPPGQAIIGGVGLSPKAGSVRAAINASCPPAPDINSDCLHPVLFRPSRPLYTLVAGRHSSSSPFLRSVSLSLSEKPTSAQTSRQKWSHTLSTYQSRPCGRQGNLWVLSLARKDREENSPLSVLTGHWYSMNTNNRPSQS